MGFRYFGPIDGHNVVELVKILQQLKEIQGPRLLHIHTVKGKGFKPAEEEATIWHAPGMFDKETGERFVKKTAGAPPRFQDVFGETLVELAKQNPKIMGVTPAMPTGCSMNLLMKEMPCRGFDVGIAEEHAVTFSGGLAKEGRLPFCNIYSAFMQRALDQVINDVALTRLHVVFCLDRAGIVGADGPTHHGVFDISQFRAIPGMTVCSPLNEHWLRKLMYTATLHEDGPWVIRYPRGNGSLGGDNEDGTPRWKCALEAVEVGKGYCLREGNGDTALLSFGPIGVESAKGIEKSGKDVAHYDMVFCKPLDVELLKEVFAKYKRIITVEDGIADGGFGSAVLEEANRQQYAGKIVRLGAPDEFVSHGSVSELYREVGIDADSIAKTINL